jgi:hypothetical protein
MISLALTVSMPLAAGSAVAQDEMPARAIVAAAATIATVQDINQETRTIVLRDPDGTLRTIVAGESVKNLDQVKKGDVVLTEVYAGFAVALAPKGSGIEVRRDEITSSQGDEGGKPSAIVTETVDVVAVVVAVDQESRLVTVRGAENTLVLKAADDVDLTNVKVGQEVLARYVAGYAFNVVPSPKVSGTVEIETKAVAAGVGVSWGSGTLTMYDGSVHKLKVSGFSFGDLGISSVKLQGNVYRLTDPADFAGAYVAGGAGAAMGKGVSTVSLSNPKNVVMHLTAQQTGVRMTLASAAVSVELVD